MTELFLQPPFWLALILAVGIAGIAWSARWLSRTGAIATGVVGLLVFWLGGGAAAVPLIVFFVSSSLLSLLSKRRKGRSRANAESGSVRNAAQVAANGAVAVALVVAHRALAFHTPLDVNRIVQVLFLAAIATVNADTWATEIGGRWGGAPRLLSNWQRVTPGTSGAVSLMGTIGAAAGALLIPLCVYRLWGMTTAEFVAVTWAAFLGSLFDSILGAGVQGQFRNPITNEVSDRAEIDGTKCLLIRGLPWVDNNLVNFAASAAGAFFCWVLLHYGLKNIL